MVTTTRDRSMVELQGIQVPAEAVDPAQFFERTRRHTTREKNQAFAGFGLTDTIEIRKADIISELYVRFKGTLVVPALGGGTVTTSARWPYDWAKFRFTANGQSNLINCRGGKLKVRKFMKDENYNDRGVSNTIGGVARTQGTLSAPNESWGVGSQTSVSAGSYAVELEWWIPVAEDEQDLAGAIFAATSATDLTLEVDWDTAGNIFALTGAATMPTLTGNIFVSSVKFSIPENNGLMVLPDLSTFHSLIAARDTTTANGDNESRVIGQGAGKSLLRAYFQVMNGGAPLPMTDTNFGRLGWRYGGNETPDEYLDGSHLRAVNESDYGTDIGSLWGFGCMEFASQNAFRDVINMGTTSELRLLYAIQSGVVLSAPALEYVIETVFAADQAA